MKLGINLCWPNYGQSDMKYNNMYLGGGSWFNVPMTVPGVLPGGQWPATMPHYPPAGQTFHSGETYTRPGNYTIACDGTGSLHYHCQGVATTCTFTGAGETYTVTLPGGRGRSLIDMGANSPTDPLRNLRVWAPGADTSGAVFYPDYVSHLKLFCCLRSMDFLNTNGSQVGTWADRSRVPGHTIEDLVDLCNLVGADCWMNLPVRVASHDGISDYPAELGTLIAARLDPKLTCYLEYGNEIWNYGSAFAGATKYVGEQCGSLDATTGVDTRLQAPDGSRLYGVAQAYGYLANACFEAVDAQIDPAKGPKTVRVFAGQAGWLGNTVDWTMREITQHGFAWKVGALACAPYSMWPKYSPYTAAAIAQLMAAGNVADAVGLYIEGAKVGIQQMAALMPPWKALADKMRVPLLYYEFAIGQDYSKNTAGAAPVMDALVADPRCADLQAYYLGAIAPYAAMGCYYQDARPGIWGMMAHLDDVGNQRYQGILKYAQQANVPAR